MHSKGWQTEQQMAASSRLASKLPKPRHQTCTPYAKCPHVADVVHIMHRMTTSCLEPALITMHA